MINSPWIQATYRLAKAFHWTPEQVNSLTMTQVNMYLQLLIEDGDQ